MILETIQDLIRSYLSFATPRGNESVNGMGDPIPSAWPWVNVARSINKARFHEKTSFLTLALCASLELANAQTSFVVYLDAAQDGGGGRQGSGFGTLTLNADNTLTYDISYSGLGGDFTASHIHGPAAPGVFASVRFTLTNVPTDTRSGALRGTTVTLDGAQAGDLTNGLYYADIHSSSFPGGEIRGQILLRQTSSADVTLTVMPSAISNQYAGMITLAVTGLTNGETVTIDKFLDANANGVIDGGDLMVQRFQLTDGQMSLIGGKTNINVPGDSNPAVSNITTLLNFGASMWSTLPAITSSSFPARSRDSRRSRILSTSPTRLISSRSRVRYAATAPPPPSPMPSWCCWARTATGTTLSAAPWRTIRAIIR